MTTQRNEEILVLYASQMGTSRRAAEAFCEEATTKLSASAIQDMTGNSDIEVTVTPTLLTMDDFLKTKQAAWTRLVVIFVSSYGMGDAPKDGHRFRDLCDVLPMKGRNILKGIQFAICGLGNSSFRTFMANPKAIEEGLRGGGANRIGDFAHADADKSGDESQKNTIAKWQEDIWDELAEVLIEEPLSEETLAAIQAKTNKLKY